MMMALALKLKAVVQKPWTQKTGANCQGNEHHPWPTARPCERICPVTVFFIGEDIILDEINGRP